MTHIFASSNLTIKGNPETAPSKQELELADGKSIAELLDETQNKKQGKDDSGQSDREALP